MPAEKKGRGSTTSLPAEEVVPTLDPVLRAEFREFQHRYEPLPRGVVNGIVRLAGEGYLPSEIAVLLRRWQKPALNRHGWTAIEVRLVLAVASDPDLRPRLLAPPA